MMPEYYAPIRGIVLVLETWGADTIPSDIYVKLSDYEQIKKRLSAAEAERDKWRTEVSKEMPPDFKDWWQNSKKEWPLVARIVLKMRRERVEEVEVERDQARAKSSRLEARCGDLQEENDRLKADCERIAESCRACMNELIDGPTTCKEEIIRIAKAALREVDCRLEARCGDLQEENERLRAALERISDWPDGAQSKIAKAALREATK